MSSSPLGLFEATGIELEYMIVDRESLDVRPIADELILAEAGRYDSEIERDDIAWSNELALHVIELKTNGPTADLAGAAERLQAEVRHVNRVLQPMGAILMPGAVHPWMDPERQLRIWPHEYNPIYETYDRIFGCRGHGWANLQSMHVNLPFADDREFALLHAAIRMLLPIMPALAASSPVLGGRITGIADMRLETYRSNARRVPSVTGLVVPEAVYTREEYQTRILDRIYTDLAPQDPAAILRHEWVNSRGCIARFDRMALEIRVLDVQECPAADLAIAAAIESVLRVLVEGGFSERSVVREFPTARLAAILARVIRAGDRALVEDFDYCRALGAPASRGTSAGDLWWRLIENCDVRDRIGGSSAAALDVILEEGCLARRLTVRAAGDDRFPRLKDLYQELIYCLSSGRPFRAGA